MALKTHVAVFNPQGRKVAEWADLGEAGHPDRHCRGEPEYCGGRCRPARRPPYDLTGQHLGLIGKRDAASNPEGFIIPSLILPWPFHPMDWCAWSTPGCTALKAIPWRAPRGQMGPEGGFLGGFLRLLQPDQSGRPARSEFCHRRKKEFPRSKFIPRLENSLEWLRGGNLCSPGKPGEETGKITASRFWRWPPTAKGGFWSWIPEPARFAFMSGGREGTAPHPFLTEPFLVFPPRRKLEAR